MGEVIQLISAADGFAYDAYHAPVPDARRGGLVIIHAVWGVTPHIRDLADAYAEGGYEVIAPSLMDRRLRGFRTQNMEADKLPGLLDYAEEIGWGAGVLDGVQAAIDALKPPVFAVGFCFGGTTAWLAACRCAGLSAVASYYGGQITRYLDETPKVPTLLHLGRADPLVPPADVAAIRAAHPDLPIHEYDAGHGFVAPTDDHNPDAARLAGLRTLQLFARNGGGRSEA